VVKLSHGWLPIGVRERRCSATTDLARNVSKSRLFPSPAAARPSTWRNRFLIHYGHLKETDTAADIRCIIIKVKWFLTGDTNDPDSETVAQIGWFQVLKGYIPEVDFRQERFYRRRRKDPKYYTGEQWTKNLLSSSGRTAHSGRSVRSRAPGDSPDNSSARSRQAAQQRVETAYAHAPLMLAHDRASSTSHWKNDYNHEPLNCWAKTMLPLSTEASATLVHNYKLVIKTSAVISPKATVATDRTTAHR
jgi:hypothetical protein